MKYPIFRLPRALLRRRRPLALARRLAPLALAAVVVPGCAAWEDGPGYWLQSAAGHLEVISRSQPVEDLIADPSTDPGLRERLELALEIRAFASSELGLPENDSYTRYADLGRPFVVWNVFAAPPLSLQLRKWCFPVAGCVSYRGFYSEADAEHFAQRMREEGYEAYVGGVPAYSTLGWFADPLLSSFVRQSELEIARLVFHELAHQRLYVKGDTDFNESYATAVERIGVARWLASRESLAGNAALREAWQAQTSRRTDFLALLKRHRDSLADLFVSGLPDDEKRARRDAIFDAIRADYAVLKEQWGGYAGYDRWFAQPLSTARLASVSTYTMLTPAFEALLVQHGSDLERFHLAASELAALPARRRGELLASLMPGPTERTVAATAPPGAPAAAAAPLAASSSDPDENLRTSRPAQTAARKPSQGADL